MTRARAVAYAVLTSVEVAYVLWSNMPSLWPPQPCSRPGIYDVCAWINPVYPWLWLGLAALLVLSAIAILLGKEAGIATGYVGQVLLLIPFVRGAANNLGSFLFTGSGFSGIDPSLRQLAFIVLALALAIGPALAALLLMTARVQVTDRWAARVASLLLAAQLVAMVAVAFGAFRGTYQDCLSNAPGTPVIDGVPGCPDFADLDIGSLVATFVPSVGVLLMVCVGVWRCRSWGIAGAFAWQAILAVLLASLGVALRTDPSQNAWYDHFPEWTSPRELAYALLLIVSAPTVAGLLTAVRWPRGFRSAPLAG